MSDLYKFPRQPYRVQQEFMDALYQVLESRQIGIFESPTGTGKTLSLICAAMRWLKEHENEALDDDDNEQPPQPQSSSSSSSTTSTNAVAKSTLPAWMLEQLQQSRAKERARRLQDRNEQRSTERARLTKVRNDDAAKAANASKRARTAVDLSGALADEHDFVLNDTGAGDSATTGETSTGLSNAAAMAVEALLRERQQQQSGTFGRTQPLAAAAVPLEEFQERKVCRACCVCVCVCHVVS
jgi:hypothetical protein